MIKFLTGTDLWRHPALASSMFFDRNRQFAQRLRWDVLVDDDGFEIDAYDVLNPVYMIVKNPDGSHAGSMRLMPMTGRTMLADHFAKNLNDLKSLQTDDIWECTRFCISPGADSSVVYTLLASAGFLMKTYGIASLLAVFDSPMLRKYRQSGVSPEVLCSSKATGTKIMVGRWNYADNLLAELIRKSDATVGQIRSALEGSASIRQVLDTTKNAEGSLRTPAPAVAVNA